MIPIKIHECAWISIFCWLWLWLINRPIDWKKFQGIPISFLGVVSKMPTVRFWGGKMAENLKKWTLTSDGKSILDWLVSLHGVDWPIDALSNECMFRPVWCNMSNRMKHKVWIVEKWILDFHAHQNPRIWPESRMKRYSNVRKYGWKPI